MFQQKCMLKPTPEILGKHLFEHSCTNNKTCFGVFLCIFGLGSFCHVRLFVELCLAMESNKQNKKMNHEEQNKIQICNASIVFLWKRQQTKHSNLKNKKPKTQQKEEPKQNWTTTSEATLHQNTRIAGKFWFTGRETSTTNTTQPTKTKRNKTNKTK